MGQFISSDHDTERQLFLCVI